VSTTWVEQLQEGDRIRLVKEKETAVVYHPFIPPPFGEHRGTLHIMRRMYSMGSHSEVDVDQMWYMDTGGRGFNGSLLVAPILQRMLLEGNTLTLEET